MQDHDHAHVVKQRMGWVQPDDNRVDQDIMAQEYLGLLRSTCDRLKQDKFTNDPAVFPHAEHEFSKSRRPGVTGLVPFPPNDQQYYIKGYYDALRSKLTPSAKPGHDCYTDVPGTSNSTWVRLCDFAQHEGNVHLFRERGQKGYSCGRVMQGELDNGYFVEALNAITLRPNLVKYLFYGYDTAKSIYIIRLFKHGWWSRVEIDDYVPVSPPPGEHHKNRGPICCVSEHFPMVMWPSLVEKGYAKLHTHRQLPMGDHANDRGGWEAIGAGGRVEDALVLLTGGVAGRFSTREVSADRLFIYLYEHQADTLFVCRVNQPACDLYGVRLNPYYPYAVNRAVTWEGRLYVQVFCAAPVCYDGGLGDISVPYSLTHCPDYPEQAADGFFWCDVNDFHLYFDTIIECHLVNTPPCAIPGMPPPRLPPPMPYLSPPMQPIQRQPVAPGSPRGAPGSLFATQPNFGPPGAPQGLQAGISRVSAPSFEGVQLPWFQSTRTTSGPISKHNAPEFTIEIPTMGENGCELLCSLDQYDHRTLMDSPTLLRPAEIRLKAYVVVNDTMIGNRADQLYQFVCKSNWLPINHSMIGLHCRHGCKIKIIAQFPDGEHVQAEKAVFRAYCTVPDFTLSVMVHKSRDLGMPPEGEQAAAVKWVLTGCVDEALMENPDVPTEFNPETDCMRKGDQDINKSWRELKQECSIM